ncbi:SemiSWEET transporter [Rickettsiales bacterium]|nr:SemiSWEET transporter [Rickettsiales bacterium]
MLLEQIIGFTAATLTTLAFVPQAIQTLRTRDTKSLSLPTYILITTGVGFWFIYGLMLNSYPMIIANIITLFLSAIILYLKIKED